MPALARGRTLVSGLKPQVRYPAGRVEDRVVDLVVRAAGEQDGPERGDAVLVRGIERDLELGNDGGLGREPLLAGEPADLPGQIDVPLGNPEAVLVGAQRDTDHATDDLEVGMMAGGLSRFCHCSDEGPTRGEVC